MKNIACVSAKIILIWLSIMYNCRDKSLTIIKNINTGKGKWSFSSPVKCTFTLSRNQLFSRKEVEYFKLNRHYRVGLRIFTFLMSMIKISPPNFIMISLYFALGMKRQFSHIRGKLYFETMNKYLDTQQFSKSWAKYMYYSIHFAAVITEMIARFIDWNYLNYNKSFLTEDVSATVFLICSNFLKNASASNVGEHKRAGKLKAKLPLGKK